MKWVDPKTLKLGKKRHHHKFDADTTETVDHIRRTLIEVYPKSLEEWMVGFDHDKHPDNEIAVWLKMAKTYEFVLPFFKQDIKVKEAVFKIILRRSFAPITQSEIDEQLAIEYTNLLSSQDIHTIVSYYDNQLPI